MPDNDRGFEHSGGQSSGLEKELSSLITEQINPRTLHIDECTTEEMLRLINEEDRLVPLAVEREIANIAKSVDAIASRLSKGGRLIYVGAGTSGRIGIQDASECPPTYGVDPEVVQAIIAGGKQALFQALEGIEDSEDAGRQDIEALGVTRRDAVVGIAASGRTPYVLSAMQEAKSRGAIVIGLSNTKDSPLSRAADIAIEVVVGPEAIAGSTRMKAGTAQKLVLNMLSTCSMIKLGKVYNNRMVDMRATNTKLRERSVRIVQDLTGLSRPEVENGLDLAGGQVKLALFMLQSGLNVEDAKKILDENDGYLKRSLRTVSQVRKGVRDS